MQISKVETLAKSLVATGFSYLRDEGLAREVERFRKVQQIALGVRRPGSAALDFAYIAAGRFSGFWECGLSPWDLAAGFLLVSEAGGKLSRYDGSNVSIYDKDVIASNGIIHDELISTIRI
jgi:myo-inositol-1(or 4)-monophosphatase